MDIKHCGVIGDEFLTEEAIEAFRKRVRIRQSEAMRLSLEVQARMREVRLRQASLKDAWKRLS